MKHPRTQVLDAYRRGALPTDEADRVKSHLGGCDACRAALEPAPRGPGLGRRLLWWFWGAVAATALGLVALQTYFGNLAPTPDDLRVLGQSEWLPGSLTVLHVRVLRQGQAVGVKGVLVTVDLAGPDPGRAVRLASVTTAGDGSARARFRLPDWPDGAYQLKVTARPGGATETVTQSVKLRRAWSLMLSTDKPVYQPGQVIRARALALRRPDLKPVSGNGLVFSVTDPKGNVIFRARGETSRFGIGSAECPLAGELIEGPYRVEARVGETTSRATVEVKTYSLPRFKVAVALDRPYYRPGEVVRGTVRADYTFGKPVAGGSVSVTLTAAGDESKPLATVEVTTGDDGSGGFHVPLPEALAGRPQDGGDASVTVTATVRDTAGQSQSRAVAVPVTTNPIRVEVIPEGGTLVRGLPNTVHVLTSYPDGRPAMARVSFPRLDGELRTDDRGAASFQLTPDRDNVSGVVEVVDGDGLVGRRKFSLTCGEPGDDFLVRTDKAVYRGGEPMTVTALGAGTEPVFVDLIRDGQTVLSESVAVNKGRGEQTIDLPAELSGTLVLCAYRYGAEGVPVRKTRVVYVRPARGLAVRASFDRPEYVPGGRARLTVTLADDRGRPAPGAVSLAAVDEAVFAVLDHKPGLERTFFTLDEGLMKPVYEVHDWSPDTPADAPGPPEAALFARTARVVDPAAALKGAMGGDLEELGPSIRRVLQRPDWQMMARRLDLPEGVMAALWGASGPHTLALSSYPEKQARVWETRRAATGAIGVAWSVLVLAVVCVTVVWAIVRAIKGAGGALNVIVLLSVAGILIGLMLPAVQSAREAGRRAQAQNDLRQLGLAAAAPGAAAPAGAEPVRVRQWFPETLLWRPEVVTDDRGRAELEFDLADAITTYRLTASAVAADGRLGATEAPLRVFQPFFVDLDLPPALTRGDEVAVPVVVSNYLDRPQTVALSLREAPWFALTGAPERTAELKPGEVRSVSFRLRAKAVGRHDLEVTARAPGAADAVRRAVVVEPDGRLVERVVSGTLRRPAEVTLDAPENASPGSVHAVVKIYPSSFSQLVEGLDAVFQRPYGCFEQTSSTTYPNVLALDYLKRTNTALPAVEAKARQYIHLGYQRLLSFEIAGGGFDWFGNPPANRVLTAYGLLEFQDMARVHDVDAALIDRTRNWLLAQQKADGSWEPEGHRLHEDPTVAVSDNRLARLSATAYVALAVFSGHPGDPKAGVTTDFLRSHPAGSVDDPYTLALVANALLAASPGTGAAGPYLDRLVALKQTSGDGALAWWGSPVTRRTMFYGSGRAGGVETTALAALALLADGRDPETTRGALSWLVGQKDAQGTWLSTQATVLALKALTAGTGKALGGDRPRRISVALDGEAVREVVIPADQSDVVRQIDLTDRLTSSGPHRLTLTDLGGTEPGFQVVSRHHVPVTGRPPGAASEPLSVRLDYDRTTLEVDDTVTVTAAVLNRQAATAPMVLLDLPVPAGFAVVADDLAGLVKGGLLAKYQLTPRSAIVYLRGLEPGRPLTLRYRLRALMPVKVTAPPAVAYEYYDPGRRGSSAPAALTVNARP